MQPTRPINKQSAWNPIRLSAGICSDGAQGVLNGYALPLAALMLIGARTLRDSYAASERARNGGTDLRRLLKRKKVRASCAASVCLFERHSIVR